MLKLKFQLGTPLLKIEYQKWDKTVIICGMNLSKWFDFAGLRVSAVAAVNILVPNITATSPKTAHSVVICTLKDDYTG